jgi:hypothetical protein
MHEESRCETSNLLELGIGSRSGNMHPGESHCIVREEIDDVAGETERAITNDF